MNEKTQELENNVKEEANALLETARKVLLASVGAFVMAGESAEKQVNGFIKDVELFVGKLVERGEIAEKDGRQLLTDIVEKRKTTAKELTDKARSVVDSAEKNTTGRFDGLVTRLNVPTKGDIETLTKKIGTLSRKVDQLKKAQAPAVKAVAKKVTAKRASVKKSKASKNGVAPKQPALPVA